MRSRKHKKAAVLLLMIYIFSIFTCKRAFAAESESAFVPINIDKEDGEIEVSSRFMELLFGKDKKEEIFLIPGGEVFGIKIDQPYVIVSEASECSALKRADKIIAVDGNKISSARDVTSLLASCGGKSLKIDVIRGGEKITLTVTPKSDGEKYKLGITLRDAAAGIGTVTFITPDGEKFGGLGHGVCEAEDGSLVEIESGDVCGVVLAGVKRGEAGKPGELSGVLNKKRYGSIDKNSECGVFGSFESYSIDGREAIPICRKSEIKTGEAEIISTVKSGKTAKYKIEISDIDTDSVGSKSFKIKVTDPTLLTLTGGIVRGMGV